VGYRSTFAALFFLIPLFPDLLNAATWDEGKFVFFDATYESVFGMWSVAFIEVPFFILCLLFSQDFFLNSAVRVRFGSNQKFWCQWLKVMLLESAAYVIYLYLLLFLRLAVAGQWSGMRGQRTFLLQGFILQVLTFLLMDILFCAITFIGRNSVLGAAVVYAFVLLDYVVSSTKALIDLKFFLKTICVAPPFMDDFLLELLLLVGLTVGLFLLLPVMSDHVDSLKKEVS
jgi:hypothetical protein